MKRKVYFSPKALERLDAVLTYLDQNWPPQVKADFIQRLDSTQQLISNYPEAFPESLAKPGVRKYNVTKHNTLYYRVKRNRIEIITIFDQRQQPKKLKKEL